MCVGEDRYWTHLPLKKTHKEKFGEGDFMNELDDLWLALDDLCEL